MTSNPHSQRPPGLAALCVDRPSIPDSHRFLLRGEWSAAKRPLLVELLAQDGHLLAALIWMQWGPNSEFTAPAGSVAAEELIAKIGLDLAREAALGMVLFRAYRMGCSKRFNYDNFWAQAFARGVAAHHVDTMLGEDSPVHAFLANFFSNFGELVLVSSDPERYDALFDGCDDGVTGERSHEIFGVDVDTACWVALRDAGLPKSIFTAPLEASRRVRRGAQDEESVAAVSALPRSYALAHLVGKLIVCDAAERMDRWTDFVGLRNELDLTRDGLNEVCDQVVDDWWDWSDLMGTPIRSLPAFSALAEWNEHYVEPVRFNALGRRELIPSNHKDEGFDILFVEDSPTVRMAVRSLLVKAGHRVQVAEDGVEAMNLLRQSPPQVILADWHMPRMDGLELCQHLRRTELGKRVYFILFTAEDEGSAIIDAYQAGINDFVTKRGSSGILLARINAAHNFIAQWACIATDRRIIRSHREHSRRIAARMKADSLTDALTGLPNRRYAMDRLREEWLRTERGDQPMSVVMLDIDYFKKVNDVHGHDVGDEVLRQTAQVLQAVTRRNEAACRIGGEEFLVICSEANLEAAASCAERIRRAVELNLINFGGFSGNITMSLGVAQRSAEVADTDALFKGADEAIYVAKESGRNRVVLWPDLDVAHFVGDRLAG